MNKDTESNWKLGMFVIIGLLLSILTIYFIGKQQNLFGSTIHLKSQFKTVSGLKVGNNVRFSGINVGTVDEIELVTDSCVVVGLMIRKEVQKFIKTDAIASIGSDGLMGDKVLTISPGNLSNKIIKDNNFIASKSSIEMEDLMKSVKTSVDNAGIITTQLAKFTYNMNNGNGSLSKLMTDKEFANSLKNTLANLEISSKEFAEFTTKMNNGKGVLSKLVSDEKLGIKLDSTMSNLESGTKGLSENMEAAKENFLLKGYFNKKKKAEAKKQEELKKKNNSKKSEEIIPKK
ncbi:MULTISPECIES: MlaD family protein [unclassified Flavobacterium]|jgi:phospholipid/cholesterol/gamma-HCH transport system substrate-binding protein|uniref:MlaD family protein n=1 Tax=unclassified Flavobacterium TaxID=196869 RepID=UPI0025B89FEF|nr:MULTISPECIES: MlaD family protein [unclassified Flavobacterium]